MQVVIQLFLDKIEHVLPDRWPLRTNIPGAQFGFGLGFKDWFLYFYTNGSNYRSSNIGRIKVFLVKITYSLYKCFPELFQTEIVYDHKVIQNFQKLLYLTLPSYL